MFGGLTALGAGIYSIGIPKDRVLQYETEVKNGKFMLVLHGTPAEVAGAHGILSTSGALETRSHLADSPVAAIT